MEKTTRFILLVGGIINVALGILFGVLSALSGHHKLFAGFFIMVVAGLIMVSLVEGGEDKLIENENN